jgi:hypothetical protein
MFLTTNRVSEFDKAILTRIHLMLRYNDLDQYEQQEPLCDSPPPKSLEEATCAWELDNRELSRFYDRS